MLIGEIYPYYASRSSKDYEFKSVGANGIIKKVVRFTEIQIDIYNLGFGDLDIATGEIDDIVVSNNGDADKVLLTVANIGYDFTNVYTNAFIFIQGSTFSRIRLYQMGITKFWNDIQLVFQILGYKDEEWVPFKKGNNYEAFLGSRKTNLR